MGNGIFRKAIGRIDLILSIRYDATPNELDQWETAFEYASRLLFDATDRQHQFGNIYVFNNDSSVRDEADVYLLDEYDISHATGYQILGSPGQHINLGRDERFRPFVLVHEFGHYAYGLYDEYIRGGPTDPFAEDETAQCIGPTGVGGTSASACIMEARWQDGDRIDGDVLVEGRVTEFCSRTHPESLGPGYHSHENLQHEENGESCWDTMVAAGPANIVGDTFDLILPTAASELPEEDTDRGEAAPINWLVLGREQRFVLILDRSNSMAGDKLTYSKFGAKFWADSSITGDRIGVISYSGSVYPDYPLDVIGGDSERVAIKNAIDLIVAGGVTAIGDGLRAGLNQILGDITATAERGQNAMVLVTDGHHNTGESPDSVVPDLVDNGIQVYTIGIGANINENLLAEIAHRTGGEFYRISPSLTQDEQQNRIKDVLIFVEHIAHGGHLVADIPGSTNPGAQMEEVYIEPGSQKATFTLTWHNPQDILFLELVSPNGTPITADSVPSNVRYVSSEEPYLSFQIQNPTDGTWQLRVRPEKVVEISHFRVFVFSQNPRISGGLISPPRLCKTELALPVQFQCYFNYPLTGLEVSGTVLVPSGQRVPIEFSDDGNRELGDVIPGDGLYSSVFTETREPGMYTIEVVVRSDAESVSYGRIGKRPDDEENGHVPIPPFRRQFRRTVGVGEVPFKDVDLEPASGHPGQTLKVTLRGRNTHFRAGHTAADFGEGVDIGAIEIVDKHTAVLSITIDDEVQSGFRDVEISTALYRETVEAEDAFQIVRRKRERGSHRYPLWKLLLLLVWGIAAVVVAVLFREAEWASVVQPILTIGLFGYAVVLLWVSWRRREYFDRNVHESP